MAVSVVLIAGFVCEKGGTLRVENDTAEIVIVYENGNPIELLYPGVAQDFVILESTSSHTFEFRTFDERELILTRTFSWEEFEESDGLTIVLE